MTAGWPTTGAVPVFTGSIEAPELAGYTTLALEAYPLVHRFMMTRYSSKEPGTMRFVGEAEVIERQTGVGGAYLAWLVLTGDPHDMPDFWAA